MASCAYLQCLLHIILVQYIRTLVVHEVQLAQRHDALSDERRGGLLGFGEHVVERLGGDAPY